MASVKVNSTIMREKANILKGSAGSIQNFTEEMSAEINRLRSTWEGDVAELTVKKFNDLKDDFEERYKTINSYADFLVKAAEEWDATNNINMQEIQNQKS